MDQLCSFRSHLYIPLSFPISLTFVCKPNVNVTAPVQYWSIVGAPTLCLLFSPNSRAFRWPTEAAAAHGVPYLICH